MGNLSAGFSARKLGREQFARQVYCAFRKHANSEVQKPTDDCVFAAVNHLNGPLRKQNFTLTGSKTHGL